MIKTTMYCLAMLVLVATAAMADAKIEIDNDTVEFGLVPQRAHFVHVFKIRSIGDEPLIIHEVETFSDCLTVTVGKHTIPPGDSTFIHVVFDSQSFVGHRDRHPKLHTNAVNTGIRTLRLHIKARVIDNIENLFPVYVTPYFLIASQYGDSTQREFKVSIVNHWDNYIPLTLAQADTTYYHLEFPTYIEPNDTIPVKIILNDLGLKTSFENSITFWYINDKEEQQYYSIPVKRKIYRPASSPE
ncbi:MAG: DUF1573 domain-containing protein [candidate division Zixibacteria bacterium]|nr:DUF1573 domain-containing protein [candidate division Zixibacteria bacterium]